MTDPTLEFEHNKDAPVFDSDRFEPDERITIDLDKKLILTHGLTAFDMPVIHNHTMKYFRLLEYPYNKLPILQFTKNHYQMKNGWKITLEHWWIPNVPLSERYYAHDIYVPLFKKEEHNSWTKEDWRVTLGRFDYLSGDYEMQAWIHRLTEEKDMVEFAPPEPETNICPLCNDIIPDDTLRSPNILCEKCHRPIACISCKEEVLEAVGITECPWCHTDTESTEKIKHAIRVRKEKKTYEEEFAERAKFMTDYATAKTNQFLDFPEHGEGTPYSSMTHAMAGIKDQDQYPHRDGPNIMERKGGWGVPFDIEKPTVASIAKEQEKIADIMLNEIDDEIEQIKEEAQRGTGRSTQRRLSAMNHLYHRESNSLYMDRRVLFIVDNMRMVKDTMRALEELYVERFNLGSGAFETLFTKKDKIIDVFSLGGISVVGEQYTLVVLDLAFPVGKAEAKKLKMNISVYGCPIIGGESIVETGEDPEPEPGREAKDFVVEESGFESKLILDGDEVQLTKSNITYKRDIQPVYGFGNRNPVILDRGVTKVEGTFEGVSALPKKREWAKPSQSLTTVITTGGNWDWGWILMRMAVAILFIVILLAMLSWGG